MANKSKLAKGITLSAITVSDLGKAKHLFCDLLGLDLAEYCEEFSWMEIKGEQGSILGVGKHSKECSDSDMQSKPGGNATVSVEVDNVVEAKKHLEDNGISFIGDIMEVPGEVKLALFSDYDGNRFFLCEKIAK